MGLTSRIVLYNVRGSSNPDAFSFSFAAGSAFTRARRRSGGIKNLLLLGDERNPDQNAPAILSYGFDFSSGNTTGGWSASSSTYFVNLPSPYPNAPGVAGLGFEANQNGVSGQFISTTFQGAENEPLALRFFLFGAPEDLAYPAVVFRRGNWQVMISNERAELMRLSSSWTQTQEDTLLGLLADTDISEAEQETIDDLKALIYRETATLDFSGELTGQWHTLVLIPEPRGVLHTLCDEGQGRRGWQQNEDADILATRQDGVLWPAGPVTVRSNGVACMWQVGRLKFARRGQLRLGPYKTGTSGTWTYNLNSSVRVDGSVSINNPAYYITGVEMENETLNSIYDEVALTLTTANTRYTPFVYAGYAYRAPGVRSSYGDDTTLDTDDLSANPVMEVSPTYEKMHRRLSLDTKVRNENGTFSQALATALGAPFTHHYFAGENIVCDVWLKGVRVIKNGIIKSAAHGNMKAFTDNQIHSEVFGGDSYLDWMICDQWALVDEYLFERVLPVGDGLTIGQYIRNCLSLLGLHSSEYSGVGSGEGLALPRARPGEAWRIQPGPGVSMGEWLRSRIELFGDGRQLWIDTDGVWQFGFRSTTPREAFVSTAGTLQLFAGSGMSRDFDGHFNIFRVEGAEGADGIAVSYEWIVQKGILPSGGTGSRKYIGRPKRYPTVRDEAFVMLADCQRAAKSLAKLHSKPGCYLMGAIIYQPDLFPGDYATFDGVVAEITQLSGGSGAWGSSTNQDFAGKLSFTARESEDW